MFVRVVLVHLFILTVTEVVTETAPSSCDNGAIDISSGRYLFDLEYAHDVVLPSGDLRKFQVYLDRLNDSIVVFGIRFFIFEVQSNVA